MKQAFRGVRLDRRAKKLLALKLPARCDDFKEIETYCMFICHARSGHTLFSSLLDAHPEIVIAQELNALELLERGLTRDRLFFGLWRRSLQFTRNGRKWNGYVYMVPNQWHGRYRKLSIIGDKMGSVSTAALKKQPHLLQKLRTTVNVPVKIFHIIRNPYDNITTISRYYHRNKLNPAIQDYFSRCAAMEKIRQEVRPEDWMDVWHEDFIAAPKNILKAACRFLGVGATTGYLADCASIVFDSPRKRRFEVNWTAAQRRQVEEEIRPYDYLLRYNFDS